MLINVTIPVFNEEARLAANFGRLLDALRAVPEHEFEVVIANNGSTDRTTRVAQELADGRSGVRAVHLPEKGRGRALKRVWLDSPAAILSYMDVDLSTDLAGFPALLGAVASGQHDLATGSRFAIGAQTTRCLRREVVSRGYSRLARLVLGTRLADLQCGFKSLSDRAAAAVLPMVEDNGWFFDTELLVRAERLGYSVCELPVHWTEDPDSRVRVVSTAWQDLKGLLRLRRQLRAR